MQSDFSAHASSPLRNQANTKRDAERSRIRPEKVQFQDCTAKTVGRSERKQAGRKAIAKGQLDNLKRCRGSRILRRVTDANLVPRAETVDEERKDDQSDDDVRPIALVSESQNAERDAGNRRGDQQQKAELNESARIERNRLAEKYRETWRKSLGSPRKTR